MISGYPPTVYTGPISTIFVVTGLSIVLEAGDGIRFQVRDLGHIRRMFAAMTQRVMLRAHAAGVVFVHCLYKTNAFLLIMKPRAIVGEFYTSPRSSAVSDAHLLSGFASS